MAMEKEETPCSETAIHNVALGTSFGVVAGAFREFFKNPPQPTPSDKVVLNPVKSKVMSKAVSSMGRHAFALGAISAVYSAGECGAEYARGVDDVYNTAIGACMAGAAAGLQSGKISNACAGCLGSALVMAAVRLGTEDGDISLNRTRLDQKRAGKREKIEPVQASI